MNILFITSTFPTPARPRQGAFNRLLVRALSRKHDVRVIAPIPWPQRFFASTAARCRGETAPRVWHPIFFYPPKILRRYFDVFYWRSIQPAVKAIQQQWKPDLVVGYWLHPDGAAAVRVSRQFGVPVLLVSGGSDLKCLPGKASRRRAIEKVVQDADRLVVVSRDLADQAVSVGADPARVDVIYRGVDRECFYPITRTDARAACGVRDDAVVVFWAGRFEKVKNPDMLLHAAVHWRKKWGDRLCVLMAGEGSMIDQVVRLRNQLGLEASVRFERNLPQADLMFRYNAADVTVLTSHSEGVPNVLLESVACSVPFVATDVGGVSEIATPGVDRLVPAGDVRGLTEAVVWRVEASVSEAVAHQRRAFVPATLREMTEQYEKAFDRVLGRDRWRQPGRESLVASSGGSKDLQEASQ